MVGRDGRKISQHIRSIENAKFSVPAGLPEEGTGMGRKLKFKIQVRILAGGTINITSTGHEEYESSYERPWSKVVISM